jgi:hypothetical protein
MARGLHWEKFLLTAYKIPEIKSLPSSQKSAENVKLAEANQQFQKFA